MILTKNISLIQLYWIAFGSIKLWQNYLGNYQLACVGGTVYKTQHRGLTSSLPHYLVVLNPRPASAKVLILGVFSSKVDKTKIRRQGEPAETLVEISPAEYDELTVDSIIDCNDPKNISIEELVQSFNTGNLQSCNDLNCKIIEKIVSGIKASRLVAEKIKNML